MRVIDKHNPRTGYIKQRVCGSYTWVTWHGGDREFVLKSSLIFPETTANAIPAV